MRNFDLFISAIDEDNDYKIDRFKEYFLHHSDIIFNEISIFISNNLHEYNKLQYIIEFYNIFDSDEKTLNIIRKIGNLIFELYIKIIDDLISNREEYCIYQYVDFFYTNNFFLKERTQIFFKKSYHILFSNLNTEESSWFIISCYRLIDLYINYYKDISLMEEYLVIGKNELLKKYIIKNIFS